MQPLLTTEQAARYLGMSESALKQMRVNGNGPTFFKLNRSVRYGEDDLQQWIRKNARQNTLQAVFEKRRTS